MENKYSLFERLIIQRKQTYKNKIINALKMINHIEGVMISTNGTPNYEVRIFINLSETFDFDCINFIYNFEKKNFFNMSSLNHFYISEFFNKYPDGKNIIEEAKTKCNEIEFIL